jgi:hypothetical protein
MGFGKNHNLNIQTKRGVSFNPLLGALVDDQ